MTGLLKLLCIISFLVGTPLLGIFFSGAPLSPYLAFPPTTAYTEPDSFSWLIVAILSLFLAATLSPFLIRYFNFPTSQEKSFPIINFPWWGWSGLAFLLLSWILAWSQFAWFQPFQMHTFTPLWIGYILVINALTFRRTGQSLLTEKPFFYLTLFPISAGFWWFFEFLNRFVRNWYYLGGIELSATEYFFLAPIPFSTVLPAVLGTTGYLETFPGLRLPYQSWRRLTISTGKGFGVAILFVASMGLMGVGIWPDLLYPLIWLSPLFIVLGLQRIWGEKTLFEDIGQGNWSPVVIPALAGLICGFFWEMWNYFSLAQWKYVVPHVHAWQIFEMPLLGYSGYLPFGITCIVFVQFLLGESSSPQFSGQFKQRISIWRVQGSTIMG